MKLLHDEMDRKIHEKMFGKQKTQDESNMMRDKMKPPTADDKVLSQKHLKQSIEFNISHVQDHMDQAKKSHELLNNPKYFNHK